MATMCSLRLILLLVAIAVVYGKPPSRISGGSATRVGEYPFIVSISMNGNHHCGGSIIGPQHILTAAHCIVNLNPEHISQMRINSGTIYYNNGGQTHSVKKIWYHREYRIGDSTSPNDIAVIELQAPMQFNANQNAIRLASTNVPTGLNAIALGWGFPSAEQPVTSYWLKKVPLQTIQPAECQQYLPYTIFTHQICGRGVQGQGVCMGDSGGPLVYNNELIGVVSYGIPCARGAPDVFTSVLLYRDWIMQVMNQQSY